jgi:shikimate dehydrogenase
MGILYAEVIGDPIAHSKSPLIHKFWLEKLRMAGDYRATRIAARELPAYLANRCSDPSWRGCSVTAPLKQEAARLALDPTGICSRIGAANAIFRSPLGCGIGANTDIIGVASALGAPGLPWHRACVIGAGGAARAILEYLRASNAAQVSLIVRDVAKAAPVHGLVHSFSACADALAGADLVVNATPLGMGGTDPMPSAVLDALEKTQDQALIFDMVYSPVQTPFLRHAAQLGRRTVDGLAMLIGQAAPAFALFFGRPPPREHDAELRELLAG